MTPARVLRTVAAMLVGVLLVGPWALGGPGYTPPAGGGSSDATTVAGVTPGTGGLAVLDDASVAAVATTIGLGTGDSPQLTAINVGHATDTTLARASAGNLTVEGNALYRAGGTDVPVTDGGTGSSTALGALTNLYGGGGISPTTLSADQNDYSPTSWSTATIVRQDATAARTITGFAAGAAWEIKRLVNISAYVLLLANESASSTAANRITAPGGTNFALMPYATVPLLYDGTTSRWRPMETGRGAMEVTLYAGAVATWTNMPSAETEWYGVTTRRRTIDTTGFTQVQAWWNVSTTGGHTTAIIGGKYSTDAGATWRYFNAAQDTTGWASIVGTGLHEGSWIDMETGAMGSVLINLYGSGGNGVVDPDAIAAGLRFR